MQRLVRRPYTFVAHSNQNYTDLTNNLANDFVFRLPSTFVTKNSVIKLKKVELLCSKILSVDEDDVVWIEVRATATSVRRLTLSRRKYVDFSDFVGELRDHLTQFGYSIIERHGHKLSLACNIIDTSAFVPLIRMSSLMAFILGFQSEVYESRFRLIRSDWPYDPTFSRSSFMLKCDALRSGNELVSVAFDGLRSLQINDYDLAFELKDTTLRDIRFWCVERGHDDLIPVLGQFISVHFSIEPQVALQQ
jgi:hypothetical protein